MPSQPHPMLTPETIIQKTQKLSYAPPFQWHPITQTLWHWIADNPTITDWDAVPFTVFQELYQTLAEYVPWEDFDNDPDTIDPYINDTNPWHIVLNALNFVDAWHQLPIASPPYPVPFY